MSKEEALATVVVTKGGGSLLPAFSLVESLSSFDFLSGSDIRFGVVKLFRTAFELSSLGRKLPLN